jgi:hypothetical protein
MNSPTLLKTFFTVSQSVFSPKRTITHSITKSTPLGGLANDLISIIAFLSRFLTAFCAARSSGLAAAKSLSASSAIAFASLAFLLTISASADTLFSF